MYRIATFLILAALAVEPARALSCGDGLTAENITPTTNPSSWGPTVGGYASASGTWTDLTGEALEITGSTSACLVGGVYDGGLTPTKEPRTFYHCETAHGWDGLEPCYPYHGSGSPAGLAPNNGFETILEHVLVKNQGDCGSAKAGGADMTVDRSWLQRCFDDAVEADFCGVESTVVVDSFLDDVNHAFAFDLRDGQAPCESQRTAYIVGNHGTLHRFAHNFEEDYGHGGIFKKDNHGENPSLTYQGNVFVLGPVSGENQVQVPEPAWFADPSQCAGNVYLWIGTPEDRDAMLATGNNGASLAALPAGCVTIVTKGASEGEGAFLQRDLPELGGISYADLHTAWQAEHFPTQPPPTGGCGIGPELAFALPLLLAFRRRT